MNARTIEASVETSSQAASGAQPALRRGLRRTRTPMARGAAREAQFVAAHAYDPFPTAFINLDTTVHSNMAWEDLPPDLTSFLLEEVQRPAIQVEGGLAISALEAARRSRSLPNGPVIEHDVNHEDFPPYTLLLKSVPQLRRGETVSITAFNMARARGRERAIADQVRLMSHDLITPVSVIAGRAQLAERSLEGGDAAAALKSIRIIEQTAKAMAGDVRKTLEGVDAIRQNPDLALEAVNAKDFIENTIINNEEISQLVTTRGVTIQVEIPQSINSLLKINVFPKETASVIGNLIKNASDTIVEKGEENGQIVLTCKISGKLLKILIRDNGCGITEDRWESIFSGKDSSIGGSGVGLSTGRSYFRALGGDICVVESTVGKGTTICAALPLSR